jgi:hypothetical protein
MRVSKRCAALPLRTRNSSNETRRSAELERSDADASSGVAQRRRSAAARCCDAGAAAAEQRAARPAAFGVARGASSSCHVSTDMIAPGAASE